MSRSAPPISWRSCNGAQQALELGFNTAAREGFNRLLAQSPIPADVRRRAAIGLAAAEIADGKFEAAEAALGRGAAPGAPGNAAAARVDCFAPQGFDRGRSARDACAPRICRRTEVSWLFVAQGMLAEGARAVAFRIKSPSMPARAQFERAKDAYGQAESRAGVDFGPPQMLLAREASAPVVRAGLPDQVKLLQQQAEQFQGRPAGFTAAGQEAGVLDLLGRKGEAQAVLQRELTLVPASERDVADQLRLLLALISGAESALGQNALRQTLIEGNQPEMQQMALQLLASGGGESDASDRFRRDLDQQFALQRQSRILDDLCSTGRGWR